MSYETAPATQLLATCCAICARPLVDAVSVETGIGPDCRRRCGLNAAPPAGDWTAVEGLLGADEARALRAAAEPRAEELGLERAAANVLVYRIAAHQTGPGVAKMAAALAALGFAKLSAMIAKRLCAVFVAIDGDTYRVKAPYNETFNEALRGHGTIFERETKTRIVPRAKRETLWAAIRKAYPAGTPIVVGDAGVKAVA